MANNLLGQILERQHAHHENASSVQPSLPGCLLAQLIRTCSTCV